MFYILKYIYYFVCLNEIIVFLVLKGGGCFGWDFFRMDCRLGGFVVCCDEVFSLWKFLVVERFVIFLRVVDLVLERCFSEYFL